MNKHILTYVEKVNESIGIGSVLLIKGKPTANGRYLYVTIIKGYAEIKPGIKMVFIGDQVYRVVHKGGTKFSGKKIDYRGEDGLKGVFNMKNPGKPSVVLNHNKTPFHWITLNHTDIGSALRDIGPRLFSHELILESSDNTNEIENWVVREFFKLSTGQDTAMIIKKINKDQFKYFEEEVMQGIMENGTGYYGGEFEMTYALLINKIPKEYREYLDSINAIEYDDPMDLGISSSALDILDMSIEVGAIFWFEFEAEAQGNYSSSPGSWDEPPSEDSEITEVELTIDPASFSIYDDTVTLTDSTQSEFKKFANFIVDEDPGEFVYRMRRIAGLATDRRETSEEYTKHILQEYTKANAVTALFKIKTEGELTPELKERWAKVFTFDVSELDRLAKPIIDEWKSLIEKYEAMENVDPNDESVKADNLRTDVLSEELSKIIKPRMYSHKLSKSNLDYIYRFNENGYIESLNYVKGLFDNILSLVKKLEVDRLNLKQFLLKNPNDDNDHRNRQRHFINILINQEELI